MNVLADMCTTTIVDTAFAAKRMTVFTEFTGAENVVHTVAEMETGRVDIRGTKLLFPELLGTNTIETKSFEQQDLKKQDIKPGGLR